MRLCEDCPDVLVPLNKNPFLGSNENLPLFLVEKEVSKLTFFDGGYLLKRDRDDVRIFPNGASQIQWSVGPFWRMAMDIVPNMDDSRVLFRNRPLGKIFYEGRVDKDRHVYSLLIPRKNSAYFLADKGEHSVERAFRFFSYEMLRQYGNFDENAIHSLGDFFFSSYMDAMSR